MVERPREPAPDVRAESPLRTGAGVAVTAHLTVVNTAAQPRILSVTTLGVDATWLPRPVRSSPIAPGASASLELVLAPAAGTVPARYPLTVAVQAIDPVSAAVTAPTGLAEIVLVVDAPGQVGIELAPADTEGLFRKRFAVVLHNSGGRPTTVRLDLQAGGSIHVGLDRDEVEVPGGESVRVRGRVRARRLRLLGHRSRHAFLVTTRGSGAPRYAQGSFTERALLGPGGAKLSALVAIVAVWALIAALAIPKLAANQTHKLTALAPSTSSTPTPSAAPSGKSGGGSSSGAGGGGSSGGAGGAASAAGGASAGGAVSAAGGAAAASAPTVRLNGTVQGAAPSGVTVSLAPTSLVDEAAEGATPVGITTQSLDAIGKVPESMVVLTAASTVSTNRSTQTATDGSWSFPGITAPGYYLVTFGKPGYETQRYIINSAETDASQPLKLALVAGQGSLSGQVTGPSGPVGGAQITISDGVNTITTSSNSTGAIGSWTVNGLSTPSTYLITATKAGLSTESKLVPLAAGASASANLVMSSGVSSLVGAVQGVNDLGATVGLGGVTVSATDGTTTRTATTVTTGPIGNYTLTGLPSPGSYAVTISADGYQTQTRQVTLAKGQSQLSVGATLSQSAGVLAGAVDNDGTPKVGQSGAGLILSNPQNTYKTLSGDGGAFRINGVASGVYVLSAELFGYTKAYATVTVTAGRTTTVPIVLTRDVNGGLPSTAQIRVLGLMDATSNGPITCGSPTNTHCAFTISVDGGASEPFESDATGGFVVPGTGGLTPGLHKVTVAVAGFYEALTTSVQVPVGPETGQVVTATIPTVAMYPSPKLTGTITAVVGQATGVCVVATAAGAAAPTGCGADGQVDPSTGAYELTLPAHGTYSARVLTPAGSEYKPVGAIPITFGLGEVKRYDAVVHRLGRLDLSVLQPDPQTGALVAAGSTTVTITGPSPQSVTTPDQAVAVITKLSAGTYHLAVGTNAVNATVGDDQEIQVILPLIVTLGQSVGRVVTSIDGASVPVVGAKVTVTGVTSYNGTAPINSSVTMTTDSRGCFAVTSAAAAPTDVGVCTGLPTPGSDDTATVRTLGLLVGQASFSVTSTSAQTVNQPNQSINSATLTTLTMQPAAATFAGNLTYASSQTPNLANAVIQVTKQAPGAGTVSVTSLANGTLTWHDSTYPADNSVRPGTYTLTATLNGYSPATVTVSCVTPGQACAPLGTFELQQLGTLVVSTAVGSAASSTPVVGASFTLSGGGGLPQSQTATPGSARVSFTGLSATPPAGTDYVLTVQAAGYTFADTDSSDITLSCTGGVGSTSIAVVAGGTTTCTAYLKRLGVITGTVHGVLGSAPTDPSQPVGNVTLSARQCTTSACTAFASGPTFGAVSAANGGYTLTGTGTDQGLGAGWWQVNSSLSGYSSASDIVQIVADGSGNITADTAHEVYLYVHTVTLEIAVQNSASSATADLVSNATLVLRDASGNVVPAPALSSPDTTHFYSTTLVPATYSLQITGPTISTVNIQLSLVIGVDPNLIYVRTDISTSSVSGSVSGVQGSDPAASGLTGALVQIGTITAGTFAADDGTDGNPMTYTTLAPSGNTLAGYFSFSNVPDGTFVVQVSMAGYSTSQQTVQVAHGSTAPALAFSLNRIAHNVMVNITSSNGFSLAGASVTLTPSGSNPTLSAQSLVASGTAGVYTTQFNSVPNGSWTLGFGFGAGGNVHFGSLSPAVSTNDVLVPQTDDTSAVTKAFTLDEGELDLSVAASTFGSDSAPTTVSLVVTAHGTTTPVIYQSAADAFPVGAGATPIYVPPGSYDVTATPPSSASPAFVAHTTNVTVPNTAVAASGLVTLQEQSSSWPILITQDTVTVNPSPPPANITNHNQPLVAGTVVLLTLNPGGGQTLPSAYNPTYTFTSPVGGGGLFTFTGLPPGAWTVTAKIGGQTATSVSVTLVAGTSGDTGGGSRTSINLPAGP